jgi:hypothetical protein
MLRARESFGSCLSNSRNRFVAWGLLKKAVAVSALDRSLKVGVEKPIIWAPQMLRWSGIVAISATAGNRNWDLRFDR